MFWGRKNLKEKKTRAKEEAGQIESSGEGMTRG